MYLSSPVCRADTIPTSSSFIALVTSCINVLVLILMHGRQLGWVCLGSCSADVRFILAQFG